jgi:putative transcriptional regulator
MSALITVAETPEYVRRAERLLSPAERMEVVELADGGERWMNKTYASIKRGLEQAIRHRKGKRVAGLRLHVPPQVDVKAVRERTGLTQEQFAATFAISLGALRHWERGDRKPRGTALVLLNVIAKEPKAVLRAVEKA